VLCRQADAGLVVHVQHQTWPRAVTKSRPTRCRPTDRDERLATVPQIGQGGPDTDLDIRWASRLNGWNTEEHRGTERPPELRSIIGFLADSLIKEPWSVGFKSPSDAHSPRRSSIGGRPAETQSGGFLTDSFDAAVDL
jgi:hypothetical protein